jgi:hypothetical protein
VEGSTTSRLTDVLISMPISLMGVLEAARAFSAAIVAASLTVVPGSHIRRSVMPATCSSSTPVGIPSRSSLDRSRRTISLDGSRTGASRCATQSIETCSYRMAHTVRDHGRPAVVRSSSMALCP